MSTENNKYHIMKFNELFPGFNGGMRELRYIAASFGINSDTYQNHENEIKRQIASQLPMPGWMEKMSGINKYLEESKVRIEAFEYMNDSRSQACLIEQAIIHFLKDVGSSSQEAQSLNSLPYRAKEKFIFLIDWWSSNSVKKEEYVLNLAAEFSNINRELRYLKWFDGDDEKVIAADDYFRKHYPFQSKRFNDAEDVLTYFYENRANKDKLELDFQKIRSLHNNRKSKKNSNAKQCNFSLSIFANRNIEMLSVENRKTRSDIVDHFFSDIKKLRKFYEGNPFSERLNFPGNDPIPGSGDPIPGSGEPIPGSGDPIPGSGEPIPGSGDPIPGSDEITPPPRPAIDTSHGLYIED